MSILKQSLDKLYFTNTLLTSTNKRNKRSKREMYHLLYRIDNNYLIYDTDPLIRTVLDKFPIPRKLIIKKEKIIIFSADWCKTCKLASERYTFFRFRFL